MLLPASFLLPVACTSSLSSTSLTMAQFKEIGDLAFDSLMASSEVDQKFLGRYAKDTHHANPFLSAMLYKVLGLSVLLSKKLIRARRLRRLDTTRDTKSLQLYHHIIWLAREGLTILEEYILAMVDSYAPELRVLAHKLRASFYHIFVLFHNQPSIHVAAIPAAKGDSTSRRSPETKGRPIDDPGPLPPGLAPVSVPKPSATFLLPARNYIPDASSYFSHASELADAHLFGSHPIRLSVKTEYAAYLYDCLHDGEASRKLAQAAIRDVYNAPEGMDDEMFEDSAEMVGILGKMMRRGLNSRTAAQNNNAASAGAGAPPPPPPSTRQGNAPATPDKRTATATARDGHGRGRGRAANANGSSPTPSLDSKSSTATTTPASSSTPRARNGGGSGSTTDPPPTRAAPSSVMKAVGEKERERVKEREKEREKEKAREKERVKEKDREREREKDRERDRDRGKGKGKGRSSSPTNGSGSGSGSGNGNGNGNGGKRRRPRAQGKR